MPAPATTIKAVLWDLDGTLAQTEPLHQALERDVLVSCGVDASEVDAALAAGETVGLRTRDAFAKLLTRWGRLELLDEAMAQRNARLEAEVVNRANPVRGANRVLLDIPMREVRFALVTSSGRQTAEALVERFGWTWRFETLVTADDVEARKPAPEPYLKALAELGLGPGEALAVEDSPAGVASARAAGVRCAGVVGTCQPDALKEATWVISDLGAVAGLLSMLQRQGGR